MCPWRAKQQVHFKVRKIAGATELLSLLLRANNCPGRGGEGKSCVIYEWPELTQGYGFLKGLDCCRESHGPLYPVVACSESDGTVNIWLEEVGDSRKLVALHLICSIEFRFLDIGLVRIIGFFLYNLTSMTELRLERPPIPDQNIRLYPELWPT